MKKSFRERKKVDPGFFQFKKRRRVDSQFLKNILGFILETSVLQCCIVTGSWWLDVRKARERPDRLASTCLGSWTQTGAESITSPRYVHLCVCIVNECLFLTVFQNVLIKKLSYLFTNQYQKDVYIQLYNSVKHS